MSGGPQGRVSGLLVRRGVERRIVVLGVAIAGLLVAFGVMRAVDDPAPGIGMLAVLPVTLIALELGIWGGLAAAAFASLLLAISAADGHPSIGVAGVAIRGVVFFATAAVAGRFSDRLNRAHRREALLLMSGLELAGAPAADRLAEVIARALVRLPGVSGARVELDGFGAAEAGTAASVETVVGITARTGSGRAYVRSAGPLDDEDHAAIELLALQAALASDNERLTAREIERAAIEHELRRVRDELMGQREDIGMVLSSQEEERARIAGRLHEELAQVLAAVLMGLRLLEREDGEERSRSVEELRAQIVDVLRELRDVASSLRPLSLDQLGLRAALEALAGEDGRVELYLANVPASLPQPLETAVYRIVQEALRAGGEGGTVRVAVGGTADDLHVDLELPCDVCDGSVLAAIRARVAALDGRVESAPGAGNAIAVRVALPSVA